MAAPGSVPRTLIVQLAGADATVLAASATVKRYIRGYRAVNTVGGTVSFSLGVAATFADATALEDQASLVGQNAEKLVYLPGNGHEVTNTNIRAFASAATSITLHLYYDEVSIN